MTLFIDCSAGSTRDEGTEKESLSYNEQVIYIQTHNDIYVFALKVFLYIFFRIIWFRFTYLDLIALI